MALRLEPGTFIGEVRSERIANAILSEVIHREGRSVPEHSHEWPFVSLLIRGTYEETVGNLTVFFKPFTAVFHEHGLTHSDLIGVGGARFFLLELGRPWRETIERLGGVQDHVYELHGEGASWPMLHLYHMLLASEISEEAVEEALFEICGYLPKAPTISNAEPPWLAEVERWLMAHFREPYSLKSVAAAAHVDPSHLARTFNRFRGRTIGEFVSRLRVQEACRRLADLDRSLLSVARESGFADQSHMTRVIRQVSGSTPAALRKSLTAQT